VYPGGQIGTGLAVVDEDPRSTVGGGGEAAELGGSADGIEMTSAWTAMDPTNGKARPRTPISNAAEARLGDRSGEPEDGATSSPERCRLVASAVAATAGNGNKPPCQQLSGDPGVFAEDAIGAIWLRSLVAPRRWYRHDHNAEQVRPIVQLRKYPDCLLLRSNVYSLEIAVHPSA
jgi:hypothetical protein